MRFLSLIFGNIYYIFTIPTCNFDFSEAKGAICFCRRVYALFVTKFLDAKEVDGSIFVKKTPLSNSNQFENLLLFYLENFLPFG